MKKPKVHFEHPRHIRAESKGHQAGLWAWCNKIWVEHATNDPKEVTCKSCLKRMEKDEISGDKE